MTRDSTVLAALLFGAVCWSASGCGNRATIPVSGEVTLDGKPLTGHLVFIPSDDTQPKRGGPIEEGRYAIGAERGPFPGPHRVEIYARRKTGRVIKGADEEQSVVETVEIVPAKYNRKSMLVADLRPRENTVDFVLTTD